MRLSIFMLAFTILICSGSHADSGDTLWTKCYGGSDHERAYDIEQTYDGGFMIAGYTRSYGAGADDVYLIKTDPFGDTVWTRTYGGSSDDRARDVLQAPDSCYIVVGYTSLPGPVGTDVWLIKTDPAGDTLWTRAYGGEENDRGYAVRETFDGGYIIVGETWNANTENQDFYLIKTDSAGDTIWTKTYGGSDYDRAFSVLQTPDSGYVIGGYTRIGTSNHDFCLFKIDRDGGMVWIRTYGGNRDDYCYSVQQTFDGGYILAGYTTQETYWHNVYIVKTDSDGLVSWSRIFGGDRNDYAYSIQQTEDGGYIIAGWTNSGLLDRYDALLVKTDPAGNTSWARNYGGSEDDYAYMVKITQDNGFILAGWTESFGAGGYDCYVIRTGTVNLPPVITDIVIDPENPSPYEPCLISAEILDTTDFVDYAFVHYDAGSGYDSVSMMNVADSFYAQIPGQPDSVFVDFYISATDNYGLTAISDTSTYFVTSRIFSIYMVPINPPIIVQQGGYFRFVGILANNTPFQQIVDVWIMIDVPRTGIYGPIVQYHDEILEPMQIVWSRGVRQAVTRWAPLGEYRYIAYCGSYPDDIVDSTSFTLTVTPGPGSSGNEGWQLSGWFDDPIDRDFPAELSLSDNYPNPFNASTIIEYALPEPGEVKISIYNINGQLIATPLDGSGQAGRHTLKWDASRYSSGIYFYTLKTRGKTIAKRMVLIK